MSQPLVDAVASAIVNLAVFAGLPLLLYAIYHRRRHRRSWGEITERAGLRLGQLRYLGYSAVAALVVAAAVAIWPPSLEASVRDGSAFQPFAGIGLGLPALVMALLYGVVKTGFAEEFLFRGLIAGSLSRRLSLVWANLVQAVIFLAPHLPLLWIMPEMWAILPLVFLGALLAGWIRIRSGSMVGPWLIHAAANVAVALSVVLRSSR